MKSIGIIVGSLREGSLTKKITKNLISPPNTEYKFIDISNLPLYNEDTESNTPETWTKFRNEVKDCEGIIFATPEYNRSIPGALKNALDVGSRPYGESVWEGKPAVIMSTSAGAVAGFGANHHLRQCCVTLNIPVMAQPEAYLGNISELMNDEGKIIFQSKCAVEKEDTPESLANKIHALEKKYFPKIIASIIQKK